MPVSVSDWLLYFVTVMLLPAVIAYLLGCSNGAVIISKYILKDDIRTHGSGNAGLTNFFRTFGGAWTLGVIAIDGLKAVLAVSVVSRMMGGTVFSEYWAAIFCLLGHIFPCMFGFKGGKGILSGGVIAIMLDWRLALLVWCGFLVLTALTRYVSLGSVFAALAFPVGTWLFVSHSPVIMLMSVLIGGLVLYMHRGNIQRLLNGTENKLSFHKKGEKK